MLLCCCAVMPTVGGLFDAWLGILVNMMAGDDVDEVCSAYDFAHL